MEPAQLTQKAQTKVYSAPKLIVYGPVEEITQGCDKSFGTTDGFTFRGLPIQCTS
jgi:hypothetical protein